MKYMGFDVGTKRIGYAVGDSESGFAFSRGIFLNDGGLEDAIRSVVVGESIDAFVVGDSQTGTSEQNSVGEVIRKFCSFLKRTYELPVHMQNEFGSSQTVRMLRKHVQGERSDSDRKISQSRQPVDAQSAGIILQRFLDAGRGK